MKRAPGGFRRPGDKPAPQLPRGTRLSTRTGQLLVASGCASLDASIGGGLSVGGVFLLEEESAQRHGNVLARYFVAEAMAVGHGVLVAGEPMAVDQQLWKLIPSRMAKGGEDKEEGSNDKLTIAWRYQQQQQQQQQQGPGSSHAFSHEFDLSKPADAEDSAVHDKCFFPAALADVATGYYEALLARIASVIAAHYGGDKIETSTAEAPSNVLRIVVHGICNPILGGGGPNEVRMFLHKLRALLRESLAVCLVTVNSYTLRQVSPSLVAHLEHLCDGVFSLTSFADVPPNPAFAEYTGLLNMVKLPRLNSLMMLTVPETLQLAYKLRRKRMVIEPILLPPEAESTQQRTSSSPSVASGPACSPSAAGIGKKNPLDF